MTTQPHTTARRLVNHVLLMMGLIFFLTASASAKIITVTGTGDTIAVDGKVTLREAITAANNHSASGDAPAGDVGLDTINFNISGGASHTITLMASLPNISESLILDGTSQPGYAGTPVIEINGNNVAVNGLFIYGGTSTVKGLIFNRFTQHGIVLSQAGGNVIIGNYIGTNASGTSALGNGQDGVNIQNSSTNNVIGGGVARNVISGNGSNGVSISGGANNNNVQGNYIGVNAAGTAALGNAGNGVSIYSNGNIVGGTTAAAQNIIAGNPRGVSLASDASGNLVEGNYIGTNSSGAALGNAQEGILLSGSNNTIGGTTAAARNVISGNATGILIFGNPATGNLVEGNYIGTNPAGDAALANTSYGIRIIGNSNTIGGTLQGARNIISGNGRGIGIDSGISGTIIQGNYIGTNAAGTSKVANSDSGVAISGSDNTVGGVAVGAGNVISGNAGDGISISGNTASNNKVQGNLIGLNVNGDSSVGNDGEGVRILGAPNNLIGGNIAGARNVISGNLRGVTLENAPATGNSLQGNYIGTDITGKLDLGNNQEGVSLYASSGNSIGGTIKGTRNIISGNDTDGIAITGGTLNIVQGNYIGTQKDGVSPLPNTDTGIAIYNSFNNSIGGTVALAGNVIASNNYAGVYVTSGNGNAILGNSIFNAARLGINLDSNDFFGLLANDAGDPDTGSNGRQNYPLLTSVIVNGGNTAIQGKLNSVPNKQFRLEFFANTKCNNSGFGEGQIYLGTASVTTDANGDAIINTMLPVAPAGQFVTATATSPTGDTSEFSPCALVGGPNPGVIQFESNFFLASEIDGTAKVNVTRSSGMLGTVTVHYATSNNSASAPSDYAATSGTLTFGDGEVIKTFTIPIVNDGLPESQENFNLTLSAPTGGAGLGFNSASQLYINDYDTTYPRTDFSDAAIVEGNNGTTNAVFHITVTSHSQVVTLGYATGDGTAQAGSDYEATTGTLTFQPGETSKDVLVPINGDTIAEGDEVFFLNLTDLSAGNVGKGQGQGNIIDDDGAASLPALSINNVTVMEPDTATGIATFNVSLSNPSAQTVTVNYATQDGTATTPSDYAAIPTTLLTFNPLETSKTVTVSINSDATVEATETLNLVLSNPVNATLAVGSQGTTTILPPVAAGSVLVSEFRFRGTAGALDEFVELYNNTNAPITVATSDGSNGWTLAASDGVARFTIPNGTVLPARGHFLGANTSAGGYSLSSYPAGVGTTATPDAAFTLDIPDAAGVALFKTATQVSFNAAYALDAVGFTNAVTDYSEGTQLASPGANDSEASFVRKTVTVGILPQTGQLSDTNDNAADFLLVSTDGATIGGVASVLGAPGPENLDSPVSKSNAQLMPAYIDPTSCQSCSPNRVRDSRVVAQGPNALLGTLSIQRSFVNPLGSGVTITRLRLRIVDITTLGSAGGGAGSGQAELRALSSSGHIFNSAGVEVATVTGTTLETAPAQANGGGVNSTLTVELPNGGLQPGESVNVQMLLGLNQAGKFRFFVSQEALQ